MSKRYREVQHHIQRMTNFHQSHHKEIFPPSSNHKKRRLR